MSENGGTPDYKVAQMDACEIIDFSVIIKLQTLITNNMVFHDARPKNKLNFQTLG